MPRHGDGGPEVARARAHYEVARTLLIGLLVLIVLTSLALIVLMGQEIRDQGKQAQRDRGVLKELLLRQDQSEKNRQRAIDEAVAKIAAEQYRALVAHDKRTQELLADTLRIVNQELNGAENQEEQAFARVLPMIPRPAPAPGPVAPQPAPAPKVGPSTGVAPAPQPAPCRERGKSGKCKR